MAEGNCGFGRDINISIEEHDHLSELYELPVGDIGVYVCGI
jgi:hypothetical protein